MRRSFIVVTTLLVGTFLVAMFFSSTSVYAGAGGNWYHSGTHLWFGNYNLEALSQ